MRQYELWWAALPQPVGMRPVLILSRDFACAHLERVAAVEITTTVRGTPQEMPLGPGDGLPARSVANFDNIVAVPRARFHARIAPLRGARIAEVKRAVGAAFAWPELTSDDSV